MNSLTINDIEPVNLGKQYLPWLKRRLLCPTGSLSKPFNAEALFKRIKAAVADVRKIDAQVDRLCLDSSGKVASGHQYDHDLLDEVRKYYWCEAGLEEDDFDRTGFDNATSVANPDGEKKSRRVTPTPKGP